MSEQGTGPEPVTEHLIPERLVVTVDGSDRALRARLGLELAKALYYEKEIDVVAIDTDEIYRALTLWALEGQGLGPDDKDEIVPEIPNLEASFIGLMANGLYKYHRVDENESLTVVRFKGEPVVAAEGMEQLIEQLLPKIRNFPKLRDTLNDFWRKALTPYKNVALVGNNAGALIYPEAKKKFYIPEMKEEKKPELTFGEDQSGEDLNDLRESIADLGRINDALYPKDAILIDPSQDMRTMARQALDAVLKWLEPTEQEEEMVGMILDASVEFFPADALEFIAEVEEGEMTAGELAAMFRNEIRPHLQHLKKNKTFPLSVEDVNAYSQLEKFLYDKHELSASELLFFRPDADLPHD